MIGVHIPKGDTHKTLEDAVISANKDGFQAGQIFLWVPQKVKLVEYDTQTLRNIILSKHLNMYIHTSYLISPWGEPAYNMAMSLKQLRQQVQIAAKGVIFHIPNKQPEELIPKLKLLIQQKPSQSRVLMENKAYKDINNSYATPTQLNRAVEVLHKQGQIPLHEINFCIDTAHLHAAGQQITTYQQMQSWLTQLKYPQTIRLIHLNGNSGTGVQDIHEIIFTKNDKIWYKTPYDQSGVKAIVEFANHHNIDLIIECKYDKPEDRINSMLLKQLLASKLKK